jgi:hypothetical protein
VRTVARKIAEWVDRLGAVWVEGQLAQVTARAGTGTAFLVLRDPAADVSLQLTAPIGLVRDAGPAVAEGNRVVVHGKPSFFLGRGTLSLRVDTIRAVGIGELLARIGPVPSAPLSELLAWLTSRAPSGSSLLLLSARDPEPYLAALRRSRRLGYGVELILIGPDAAAHAQNARIARLPVMTASVEPGWELPRAIALAG